MNVFYLNNDPVKCAQEHCDKHVVKMVIEYAQLLSTAHRMLDGDEYEDKTKNGRRIRRWKLSDSREGKLYKASHVSHPDAIWARESCGNYNYLYKLFSALCEEYSHRYGRVHETDRKLRKLLSLPPENLPCGDMSIPPQCMNDHCKTADTISAYKNYYIMEKKKFAKWTKRSIPNWFAEAVEK